MPKSLRFDLTDKQREELVALRDHSPKPCVRERSAIVLKIADGASATEVARSGLFQTRDLETVRAWYWRYRKEGLAGLLTRPGRGRKPAFSPCAPGSSQSTRGRVACGAS
jgi:hypothetical protein